MTEVIASVFAACVGGAIAALLVRKLQLRYPRFLPPAYRSTVEQDRQEASRSLAAPLPADPECDHDWREDPEGWKDDDPFMGALVHVKDIGKPNVIQDQSLTFVCPKCTKFRKEWRRVAKVDDWPKAPTYIAEGTITANQLDPEKDAEALNRKLQS